MNVKRIAAGILSAAVLTISTAGVFAANENSLMTRAVNEPVVTTSITEDVQMKLYYKQFRGTVKTISDYKAIEGAKFISVEGASGEPANIIVDKDTYILDKEEIAVGSEISAYYDANANMIMIYPPQYKAEVIVVENESRNVKVDMFDEELVSADNFLKLMNISEVKDIVNEDATAFKGDLKNKELVVVYTIATKSIPAQTTPVKIVVLNKAADTDLQTVVSVTGSDVFVYGEKITAPAAYVNDAGVQMVPLRATAEAMGYEVTWNNAERSVTLGSDVKLKIGEESFSINGEKAEMTSVSLIIDGRTFVPVSFFEIIK